MVHPPVPTRGALPPSPAVVPPSQIVCGPPALAAVGGGVMVTNTSKKLSMQGGLLMVQRSCTGPRPPVWVKAALGSLAAGPKVPVPPPTMVQPPVPSTGVLPPRAAEVPDAQIVCGPPAVAVVGGATRVKVQVAQGPAALPLPFLGTTRQL